MGTVVKIEMRKWVRYHMKHTQRKIIHIIKQGLSKGTAHLFFQISKDQKSNFNSQIRSKHINMTRGAQ